MNDKELFLEAIKKIPDDPYEAKFDGFVWEKKQHTSKPRTDFDMIVDLHGFNKREALRKLKMILTKTRNSGQKLLIITGRGNNSEDGICVIRETIVTYLGREGAKFIRSYCTAPPKHGGNGAIIILT